MGDDRDFLLNCLKASCREPRSESQCRGGPRTALSSRLSSTSTLETSGRQAEDLEKSWKPLWCKVVDVRWLSEPVDVGSMKLGGNARLTKAATRFHAFRKIRQHKTTLLTRGVATAGKFHCKDDNLPQLLWQPIMT